MRPRAMALTVAVAAAMAASAGQAAAATPTLTGELLGAQSLSPDCLPVGNVGGTVCLPPGDVHFTSNCNPDGSGTISYTASGVAAGPYPGTFTERGSATLGAEDPTVAAFVMNHTIVSFDAEFTIDSPAGEVSGTKTLDAMIGGPLGQRGTCNGPPPHNARAFVVPVGARYAATITSADGRFNDRGTTPVRVEDDGTDVNNGTELGFVGEAFTSDLASPEPALPTDADQCKKGGWQAYGIFKNQGDCVSFVVTGGKNPPAGG